MELVRGNKNRL